jgi:hypothetical protein
VTCPDSFRAAVGERSRTGVNETRTETRPGSRTHRVAGFRGLRGAIHYRPRAPFGKSFANLERLLTGLATGAFGQLAASVTAISGDVHHSYLTGLGGKKFRRA